ncbi:hypothetical protein SHKM778_43140 [Streptomyces sp. KM77-8]|uniref:Amidohydrolase-related domain-containing protein n=1 Tax=Streptomyces haneummycinicus TaxID=3074435 RepID=A0AAT9HL03_9ACTN
MVDHLGKPPVGGGPEDRTRWRGLLAAAAQHPQVHAKVSGLYSARGPSAPGPPTGYARTSRTRWSCSGRTG